MGILRELFGGTSITVIERDVCPEGTVHAYPDKVGQLHKTKELRDRENYILKTKEIAYKLKSRLSEYCEDISYTRLVGYDGDPAHGSIIDPEVQGDDLPWTPCNFSKFRGRMSLSDFATFLAENREMIVEMLKEVEEGE